MQWNIIVFDSDGSQKVWMTKPISAAAILRLLRRWGLCASAHLRTNSYGPLPEFCCYAIAKILPSYVESVAEPLVTQMNI